MITQQTIETVETTETVTLTPEELLLDRGLTFEECYQKHFKLTGYTQKKLRGLLEVIKADKEDIQQECAIGLFEAFNKYDNNRGIKFSTYAIVFMRGRILRYLRDNHNLIRKPRAVHALEKFCREHDIVQYEDLLPHSSRLEELGISLRSLKRYFTDILVFRETISADDTYSTDKGVKPVSDTFGIKDSNYTSVDFESILKGFELNDADLTMVKLYLEGYTQKEIGEVLGVSQVHIGRKLRGLKNKPNVKQLLN